MKINRTITNILIVVAVLLTIPIVYLYWKMPVVKLSSSEKELISFNSSTVSMADVKPKTAFSGLEVPVKPLENIAPAEVLPDDKVLLSIPAAPVLKSNTTIKKMPATQQPISQASLPTVSMVYSDGITMMAMIDGNVVREGMLFGTFKIIKIEQKRVLIRSNGKNVWLDVN